MAPAPTDGRGKRVLSEAERADWEAIARSIRPLRPQPLPPPAPLRVSEAERPRPAPRSGPRPAPPVKPNASPPPVRRPPPPLPAIEPKILRALRRGQLDIDLKLDLHGETQASAHRHLERALASARARGGRVALIVTGKGSSAAPPDDLSRERGILRRMVPEWLALAPLSVWVLGVAQAGPAHGGTGALYVVLRRAR